MNVRLILILPTTLVIQVEQSVCVCVCVCVCVWAITFEVTFNLRRPIWQAGSP